MNVTRTLGPLHLEDLEPHRFEDLVRQLLYDFRNWRDLEATGRTGSDAGFDVRAWEIIGGGAEDVAEDESGEDPLPATPDARQWLIQCKREKTIGPAKMASHVASLPKASEADLYGLVFVAACDFSITTRERFYQAARRAGFQEVKLWGKAEVEDLLFQPKNDHLLFAYFGVSLQMRRRSLKTDIRARLAMKRKALRHLQPYSAVLVRDASDERYPYLDRDERLSRAARGRWKVYRFESCGPFGIELLYRRHFAVIAEDGESWDFAETMDDAPPHDDPWPDRSRPDDDEARSEAMAIWDAHPEGNRGWFEMTLVLPYEAVIDIDAEGDEFFSYPHIYVGAFSPTGNGPFADFKRVSLSTNGNWGRSCDADESKRIAVFPRLPSP